MLSLEEMLKKYPLVIVKLGAGGDDYGFVPETIRPYTVLVCLDAGATPVDPEHGRAEFARRILIKEAISEDSRTCTFIERAWWGCSSLLEVKPEVMEKYGHEKFNEEKSRTTHQPVTLTDILHANELSSFDVLLTDLEGLDLRIVKSCGDLIDSATIIQSELRFEPYYQGESYFHEAAAYLTGRGFNLIGIKPEYWKPVSKNRRFHYTDGVAVFADCLFFRSRSVAQSSVPYVESELVFLTKSIILLSLFGKKSLAAHLYEKHAAAFNGPLRTQLAAFLRPTKLARARNLLQEIRLSLSRGKRYLVCLIRTGRWRQESHFRFEHIAKPKYNL